MVTGVSTMFIIKVDGGWIEGGKDGQLPQP